MISVDIKQFKKATDAGKRKLTGKYEGMPVSFYFTKVRVGYGYKHYFICPNCGSNRSRLVFNGTMFYCVQCLRVNPYRGIQTTTRGGDVFIMYKMNRIAQKQGIIIKYPFDYHDYERPRGKWVKQWEKSLKILQALENMRSQSIFFRKVWGVETIRSVEEGTNAYLEYPVSLLLKYFYPFDGKAVNAGMLTSMLTKKW